MTMKIKTTKISETWMLTCFAKFVPTKMTNHTVVGNVLNINCTADHRESFQEPSSVQYSGEFHGTSILWLLYYLNEDFMVASSLAKCCWVYNNSLDSLAEVSSYHNTKCKQSNNTRHYLASHGAVSTVKL